LRGPAALSKSSMLLELLRLVAGRLGGALALLVLDTERIIGGGPRELTSVVGLGPAGGGVMVDRGGAMGGALARPASRPAIGGPPMGGAGVADTERGAALGGGGVDTLACWSLGSAFLLTQRFCSGS
jgi:hypothetical protein